MFQFKWQLPTMMLLILAGCGSATSTTTGTAASCASGYVDTSGYGCLSQGSCPSGYGSYNGTCVAGTSITASSGGCIPISQAIPFYGSGLQVDSSNNVYGGTIPSAGVYGPMTVGTSTAVSGTTFSSVSTGETYSVGTFQMVAQSLVSGTSSLTVSGQLTIGTYYQQLIQNASSSYSGAGTYGSSACVSGIAIQGHLYTSGSYGFSGTVYLYMNGTQHGYALTFY